MSLIEWTEDMAIGVGYLDKQHREIIGIINNLYVSMKDGTGIGEMDSVIKRLEEYTVYHFSDEERVLEETGYPDTSEMQVSHEDFRKKLLEFRNKLKEKHPAVAVQVLGFLSLWLRGHIMGMDKKIGPFLNQRGIS